MENELYIVEGSSEYYTTIEEAKECAQSIAYTWLMSELCPITKREVFGSLVYGYGNGSACINTTVNTPLFHTQNEVNDIIKEYRIKCKQYSKYIKQ